MSCEHFVSNLWSKSGNHDNGAHSSLNLCIHKCSHKRGKRRVKEVVEFSWFIDELVSELENYSTAPFYKDSACQVIFLLSSIIKFELCKCFSQFLLAKWPIMIIEPIHLWICAYRKNAYSQVRILMFWGGPKLDIRY